MQLGVDKSRFIILVRFKQCAVCVVEECIRAVIVFYTGIEKRFAAIQSTQWELGVC